MIRIEIFISEMKPGAIGMEVRVGAHEPTIGEKRFTEDVLKLIENGPQVDGVKKVGEFDVSKPRSN